MKRQQYLGQLKKNLRNLPPREIDEVISYYDEYFADAGADQEAAVIAELGNPQKLAGRILAETVVKYFDEPVESVKGGIKGAKLAILAVCASPIAVPLAFAAIMVIVSLAFAALLVYASMWLVAVTLGLSGVVGIIAGIFFLFSQFANGIAIIGASLICVSLSVFVTYGSYKAGRWVFRGVSKFCVSFFRRRAAK